MIDIVTCWPKDCYYPLFVSQINRDRHLFNKVIIVMTSGQLDTDFSGVIAIKNTTIVNSKGGSGDWRDIATKTGLVRCKSERVLFLEQDFFYHKGFMEKLTQSNEDMVGFIDGNRFHPGCLLVRKKLLNRDDLDFSASPPDYDHFGKLTRQIVGKPFDRLEIEGWYHLSGLTYNFRIPEAFHKRNEFYTYCELCKKLPQPEVWREFGKKFDGFSHDFNSEIASYFYEYIS